MNNNINLKLNNFSVFKGTSDKERLIIARYLNYFIYHPGDTILKQGQEGDGLFFLVSGKVDVSTQLFGDNQLKLAQLSDGMIFGEISLFSSLVVTASVHAVTKVKVLYLEKQIFDHLRYSHPKITGIICLNIITDLCGKVRNSGGLNLNILGSTFQANLASTNKKEMMKEKKITGKIINQTIRHFEDLAMDLSKQIDLLKNIEFCKHLVYYSLKRQQVIYDAHETFNGVIYLVAKGAVQTSINTDSNTNYKIQVSGPGSLIGALSYFDNNGRYGTAICRENSILIGIKKQAIESLYKKDFLKFNSLNDLLFASICYMLDRNNKLRLRANAYKMLLT